MIIAYKSHMQFIMILTIMYVSGVWGGPIIYPMFPIVLIMLGSKRFFFELYIVAIWLLMLADYVPVKNALYDDLQFAKDLKFLIPLALFGFMFLFRNEFKPYPKMILWFVPFFIIAIISLNYSINFQVGSQKTLSFVLMYLCVPFYVTHLHRKQGEGFWKALMTFIIGMLSIGVVLRFAAPQIALIEGTTRFKSVLGNPNGLGIFLYLTFVLWIVLMEFKLAKFTKKENWYIFSIIIISLIWCGSRNGIMNVLIFYIIHRLIKINWFLSIIAVGLLIGFQDQLFDVLISVVDFFSLGGYFRVETIEEGSGRKVAWVFAWQEIQNYYFLGGGFGHDEHIMRPNYWWLARLGHQGGVHNSYLSLWFDTGIVGVFAYFIAFIANIIRSMRNNYLVIAFGITIFFNITYESWLVASLNPFTILFLTILTIFTGNLKGSDYVQEEVTYDVEKAT
ncbi:MAG: O-antigen ligase family protein [Flavobacteriales bacterium]|nr:O-antigen ligase family protein [Flavobacteriales bacterium]